MWPDDDPEVLAVRARHDDIPQDALPLEGLPPPCSIARSKPQGAPAIRYQKCPRCSIEKVAVIRGNGDSEVLQDHNRVYYTGFRIHCPGSGSIA